MGHGFYGVEITVDSPKILNMGQYVGGTGKKAGVGRGAGFGRCLPLGAAPGCVPGEAKQFSDPASLFLPYTAFLSPLGVSTLPSISLV